MTELRNDIQGLRALAVVAVILYHFKIGPFTGGFVGVDVFFVISGYLITRKLARDTASGRYSLGDFTTSRARRLLPALFTTILAVFVAGAIIFNPLDFQRLSASAVFATLGASNWLFWFESGYFDADAILKPLLHTWSLGVEIQFYLVWPFVVVWATRKGWPTLTLAIAAVASASFSASALVLDADSSAAFFFTPLRMWEFAVGGLVFCLERHRPSRAVAEMSYVAGIAAVTVPFFLYSDVTQFPGASAVAPVLGTAALIYVGPYARLAVPSGYLLPRFLGEISYSLYLVHWPLVVFAQYLLVRELTDTDHAMLVAATLMSAVLLYYTVEQPLRRPWSGGRLRPATALVTAAAVLIMPASTSWAGNGWAWRTPEEIRAVNQINIPEMKEFIWRRHRELRAETFGNEPLKVLVIGDSMSADFVNMLQYAFEPGQASIRAIEILRFCAALHIPEEARDHFWKKENTFTAKANSAIPGCKDAQRRMFSSSLLKQADLVFVANYWYEWAPPYLKGTLEKFAEASTAKVYFVGRKDLLKSSISIVNARQTFSGISAYASTLKDPETERVNRQVRAAVPDNYLDLMALVCPRRDACNVIDEERMPIFWDKAHVTPQGARFLGRKLKTLPGISLLASVG